MEISEESIYYQYRARVGENKAKRHQRIDYQGGEPPEVIVEDVEQFFTTEDGQEFPHTERMQWYSLYWLCDLFGDDWIVVQRLMFDIQSGQFRLINGCPYYEEDCIVRHIEILKTLANSNFVRAFIPTPQIHQGVEVYTDEQIMSVLKIGKTTLRKFVQEGLLTYSQAEGSDKRYYTRDNIIDFLKRTQHEAFK